MSEYRVAVVGATGAVGTVMRAKLRERRFPAREVVPFASARSAGSELDGATVQPMVALKPLYDAAGIERLIVSTYQSVSGTGVRAVEELEAQTHAVLHGQAPPAPQVYPHQIAFNVLGGAGNFADGDDHTDEERKMMFETRKILGDESIPVAVTCARVPVVSSHSESVSVQTHERGLQLWVVSDNLFKGAATNAVQIAEVLHERNLVKRVHSLNP